MTNQPNSHGLTVSVSSGRHARGETPYWKGCCWIRMRESLVSRRTVLVSFVLSLLLVLLVCNCSERQEEF